MTSFPLLPTHRTRLGHAAALAGAIVLMYLASIARGEEPISFNRDIRPILSENCFQCHGPDKGQRQADLRLDQREVAVQFGAIVPGKVDESELVARVTSDDADVRMPPPRSKKVLTSAQKQLLLRWIAEGAAYESHWAFIPPADVAPPQVKNASWPRNAIDRFVLHRLEAAGLEPSPEASREKLIRRLSFDLTGLPTTLEEIDAFLADASPDAYEKLVDRLLASERFGERMAADWLDVARYSDTYGYQVDRDRYVWPWRDWVIRAFNRNLPYDEFITEQLAGDLLPGASDEQILATTFNRLHPQKVEGGSTPEEFRVEYVADRVQTFATALLGLTLECARCHDHKFDPVAQKEYYQLAAFFDNIDEAGLYSFFTPSVPTPTLLLADENMKARLAEAARKAEAAEEKLAEIAAGRREAFEAWLNGEERQAAIPGRIAHLDFENHKGGANASVAGRVGKAVKLTGDDGIGLKVGNFRRSQPFSVALWMNTPDEKERAVVFHRSRAWTDAGSRGYQLLIEDGRLSASLIHFWPGNAIRVRTRDMLPTNAWQHVAVTYDGSSRAAGLAIFVNGRRAETEVVRDHLYKNITGGGGDNITIGERFRDRGFTNGLVDEFAVYDRQLTPLEVAALHDGSSLQAALETDPAKLSVAKRAELLAYYLAARDEMYGRQLAALQKLREEHNKLADGIQEIMVMREMRKPRATYLLKRGAYDARVEEVSPDTPAVFPPFSEGAPRNRLGLARWLTREDHPLTARVAVNRFWQMLLGEGLVRTPEDFGSQGRVPTHPALLDWLARNFVQGGWDVKRLLKQIVMSATYRQASTARPELIARDPENRLLARASAYRLPAEMLRDNALAVSGLLVTRLGGPPARPYELEVSFKPVNRQKGEGLYRRSVYTYWKRTGPAPVMMTLDAAKRDVCRVRRERTSSPLQALVLLNGPQFVEAARVLGARLIAQHGDDTAAAISDMFRLLTSRRPTDAEAKLLGDLYRRQLDVFQKDPKRASAYLAVGDAPLDKETDAARLAAMTLVANTLMNFDECLLKR